MFGKKKEQKSEQQKPKPKLEPYKIEVMPPKFHKYLAVKKMSLGKLAIILGIIIIAVLAIGSGFLYFFIMSQQPADNNVPATPAPPAQTPTPAPETNVNDNTNTDTDTDIDNNTDTDTDNDNEIPDDQPEEDNDDLADDDQAFLISDDLLSSADSDNDGLTDFEEELYGTEINKADTDEDGYQDGAEFKTLFNPMAASGALLVNSGLVNIYTNPTFNYDLYHPAGWLAKTTDMSLEEVVFQSATGEYFSLVIERNPDNLSLVDWIVNQFPDADLDQLQITENKQDYQVVISEDKMTNYIMPFSNSEIVYVLNYESGGTEQLNFMTSFEMVRNSFNVSGE